MSAGNVFFPVPPNGSGAAALVKAADDAAAVLAEAHAAVTESHQLRCRIEELEAENAALRERIEEYQWDHKDDRPTSTGPERSPA